MRKKQIVVLGGGIAGIEFLVRINKQIDHSQYELSLIDKNEFHTWKPMLHTFAAGTASPQEQGMPFLIQAKRHNFTFQPGEVSEVNTEKKEIILAPYIDKHDDEILPQRTVHYDYLVVALGSRANDFNTKGVKEFAYTIDDVGYAIEFYDDLKKYTIQSTLLQKKHHIIIVGAGATGIELAGEVVHVLQQSSQYTNHNLEKYIDITVIQSGDRVLPSFKKPISRSVQKTMDRIGVKTLLSTRVTEVTKDHVVLSSGETLPANQVVWTTGIKATEISGDISNGERSKNLQLIVNSQFQLLNHPDIFVIGDCSFMQDKPLAPTAQVARQQAIYLSKNFIKIIHKETNIPRFMYKDYGSLISVGRYGSFGSFGSTGQVKGILAHLAHILLYRTHQMNILGTFRGISAILADLLRNLSR
ncbi:NAD(P)/FAD-dependent oxidoreductase [Commensalibacter papalotli (ex Botero et al. 2024)]|uniref:NAD(P)/FAD-dependent oxidoreductase n=1 Tax=Commensalibacter papalotli (ex Botero et al. 2024) TaxID=2972766 RepID=UPI0022FFB8A6|nr:NAD(P)/FAD-dependent oxidoreductase [Commensalibacter papalotli (ex Botero et al. 2024)]CAI3941785.1 FAD-containing subunit (Ndh) (PDB:5NA4) [Commensalibacter papalotli (ex Botero et al. 2024)]